MNYQKRLLMLGGGFLQTYVIKKAKQLGYYVLVLDANPQAEGFKYADEFSVINIVDEESCLQYAKEKRIDGVLTAATDFSVLTMSIIAEELNLPGINYNSAKIIKNKALTRNCLLQNKVDDTEESILIDVETNIEELSERINYPVMVKPCDGSGSRGTSRVDNQKDLANACDIAIISSISKQATIEPFIFGKEYGVESFVDNGNILVLGIMKKEMTDPPYYAELGHSIPSGLSSEFENKIKRYVTNAIKALNINHGSVNMDILVTDEGKIHIVDIGARMGGNLIGSHIIPIGTGIEYMQNMIASAVRDKTNWTVRNRPTAIATRLLALHPGKVKELPNFENIKSKYSVEIEHHLHIGDQITPYRTNLDGCGYVLSSKGDVENCKKIAATVIKEIDESIIRE